MSAITTIPQLDTYLESFNGFQKNAAGHELGWLRKLREDAFARFCEVGFPTTHDEDWRFTNVSAIAKASFKLAATDAHNVSAPDLATYRLPESACELVFIDGNFAPELSEIGKLPQGVEVNSLAAAIKANPSAVEPHLGRYLDTKRDAFAALNSAFANDGGFVSVKKGVVLERPIHLLFVSTAGETPLMAHPRNLIVAEDESQVAVVEDYVSLKGGIAFSNTATELVAGGSAVVSHYMLEREHTDAFNISTL